MKSTIKKNKESVNRQLSVENQDSSNSSEEKLVEFKEVENSPLVIAIDRTEKKTRYCVLLGNSRLSEIFDSEEKAVLDAKRTDMNRLVQVIAIVQERMLNLKNE